MITEQTQTELVEKWKDVLDYDGAAPIRESYKRQVTAVLLENQAKEDKNIYRRDPQDNLTRLLTEAAPINSMGASSSIASTGSVDIYDPVMISLVRRTAPNLMAYDVCGVQPMTGPTGLIFALRSRYNNQSGIEALFNEANTTFGASAKGNTASITAAGNQVGNDPSLIISGGNTAYTVGRGMSTAAAEALGDSATNGIQEMAMSIEKVSVTATSRALKAEYSHELAQDLKNVHGLDAESELANLLAKELLAEINREVIRSIATTATFGAQDNTTTAGTFDCDVDSNGRHMVEKFQGLSFQIEREANAISKATRAGKGNFIITSSDVASALSRANILDYRPALNAAELEVDDTGNTFAGVIHGRIKVYIDPYFDSSAGSQFVVTGYKGASAWDAGLFYCPYVPLQMYRTMGQDTFQPRIGFKTRYGLVAHPFATTNATGAVSPSLKNRYYRLFRVTNLM